VVKSARYLLRCRAAVNGWYKGAAIQREPGTRSGGSLHPGGLP
jgi:hypothetical protein